MSPIQELLDEESESQIKQALLVVTESKESGVNNLIKNKDARLKKEVEDFTQVECNKYIVSEDSSIMSCLNFSLVEEFDESVGMSPSD